MALEALLKLMSLLKIYLQEIVSTHGIDKPLLLNTGPAGKEDD
jgi:hypothetical protein